MPETFPIGPPQVALLAAIAALVLVIVAGVGVYRRTRSLARTSEAANLLVGVHLDALSVRSARGGELAARLGERQVGLSRDVDYLLRSIDELRFLTGLVTDERRQFGEQVLDIVLPTSRRPQASRARTRRMGGEPEPVAPPGEKPAAAPPKGPVPEPPVGRPVPSPDRGDRARDEAKGDERPFGRRV